MSFNIKQLGRVSYSDGLKAQQEMHTVVSNGGEDAILLCEHNHVYTFGKSADKTNLLISPTLLKAIGAEVYETDRGGDITYHGPGQLVGYPIINLRKHGIGVKKYVETLEESIIQALLELDIQAYQIEGLTGIWIGESEEEKRKIGAIGIRIRNGVSMHGFALNISTDLSYFNHIVPCGITDKSVTSIMLEVGNTDIALFESLFLKHFTDKWENSLNLLSPEKK